MNTPTLSQHHLNFLLSIAGAEHVSVTHADREQHARDQSFHPPHPPAAVVWPASAEEISAILRYANQHGVPVTP